MQFKILIYIYIYIYEPNMNMSFISLLVVLYHQLKLHFINFLTAATNFKAIDLGLVNYSVTWNWRINQLGLMESSYLRVSS